MPQSQWFYLFVPCLSSRGPQLGLFCPKPFSKHIVGAQWIFVEKGHLREEKGHLRARKHAKPLAHSEPSRFIPCLSLGLRMEGFSFCPHKHCHFQRPKESSTHLLRKGARCVQTDLQSFKHPRVQNLAQAHSSLSDLAQVMSPLWACFPICERG